LIRPFLLCFTEIAGVSVPSETVSQWNPQRRQETALPIRETDEPNSLYLGPSAGGETYRAPQSSRKGPFRRSCREKHCSCGRGGGAGRTQPSNQPVMDSVSRSLASIFTFATRKQSKKMIAERTGILPRTER